MRIVVWFLLVICSSLLSIPVLVLLLEVAASVTIPRRRNPTSRSGRGRVAILVPAHNESSGLLPTLQDLQSQLHSGDRLLVVADNCTDDTATIAKRTGSEVIERHDLHRVGKGFALDFGLRHLSLEPPEIVVIVDADCRIDEGSIDRLAEQCARTSRPAQSLNLMVSPENGSDAQRVPEFAWRLKNWVRPLGLLSLEMPCQLMGTGMAFPWPVIWSADLANGELVEDLRLGLELAAIGKSAIFCPDARVTSPFPSSIDAAESQRQRWEGGQLGIITKTAPKMFVAAVAKSNLELLILVLDLLVPPVTVLVALLMIDLFLTMLAFLVLSQHTPLLLSLFNFFAFAAALVVAWVKFGQDILTPARISLVPKYVLEKIGLYIRMYSRNAAAEWVRTDRDKKED